MAALSLNTELASFGLHEACSGLWSTQLHVVSFEWLVWSSLAGMVEKGVSLLWVCPWTRTT